MFHATTILAYKGKNKSVIGGDGQVSFGNTVLKGNAVKIRKLNNGKVLAGFAGSTADAFNLFDMFENLGLKIDKAVSDSLYTSILTDTGGFRFENTSAKTFQIASKLVEYGTHAGEIARYCFESKPKPMVLLQANALMNAEFLENQKIAYTCITMSDMEHFQAKEDYTEGIVGALRQIKTTEVAAVLKEVNEQTTKVSLRSKHVDVSKIAAAFDGGGHAFAAGCTIQKPVKIAKDKLVEEIKRYL